MNERRFPVVGQAKGDIAHKRIRFFIKLRQLTCDVPFLAPESLVVHEILGIRGMG
jgi:hypothetical protein